MDFFYRNKPWYAGQFVRMITPKMELKRGSILFLTVVLNSLKGLFQSVLVRDFDAKFLSTKVDLPIAADGNIDFEFIESLIADLERERITTLKAYLSTAGLDNYTLTDQERAIVAEYENLEWGEFKLGDLFKMVRTKKLPYKAEELKRHAEGEYTLPCLTSSFRNQGLNYYAPAQGATILKNVISIPSNSDVYRAYFQSNEFTVLSDAYAIRWNYDDIDLLSNQYLFVVSSINKVTDLPIYSYKTKLGSWRKVKEKSILLPIKNKQIDYKAMNTLISAIKKLAIKDVAEYATNSGR